MNEMLYIARDKDGALFLYEIKPIKGEFSWIMPRGYFCRLPENLFPCVKWEDENPKVLLIK